MREIQYKLIAWSWSVSATNWRCLESIYISCFLFGFIAFFFLVASMLVTLPCFAKIAFWRRWWCGLGHRLLPKSPRHESAPAKPRQLQRCDGVTLGIWVPESNRINWIVGDMVWKLSCPRDPSKPCQLLHFDQSLFWGKISDRVVPSALDFDRSLFSFEIQPSGRGNHVLEAAAVPYDITPFPFVARECCATFKRWVREGP